MRILVVVDVEYWAIGRLAKAVIDNNPHHTFEFVAIHPREVTDAHIIGLDTLLDSFKPELIHWHYWRTAEQVIDLLPKLKEYKQILTHHNQKSAALNSRKWTEDMGIDCLITQTERCKEKLEANGNKNVKVVTHGVNMDFFTYSDKEPEIQSIGYVGRVVPWKGLKEIANVAKKLDVPLLMMGKIDKANYWAEVDKTKLQFDFFDVADEDSNKIYRNITIYVGNSVDGYEEGTMPYLEAMASGVPVVTTPNGQARDIGIDGENCLLVNFEDEEHLEEQIKRLLADKPLRDKLRKGGWNAVKLKNNKQSAREHSEVYNEVAYEESLVSVIVPTTHERAKQISHILTDLTKQTYKHFEVILAYDEVEGLSEEGKKEIRAIWDELTIKFVTTGKEGYNLAMARNMAAIEAEGKYLMFLDSRLSPEPEAIEVFVVSMGDETRTWLFGDKGNNKQSFVENFSFVTRTSFINFGMCCERITKYGGMSQEIRTRWSKFGGQFVLNSGAMAKEIISSKNSSKKRKEIIEMKMKLYKMYGKVRY